MTATLDAPPRDESQGEDVTPKNGLATLYAALVKVQEKLKNPTKDATNPHFKSSYLSLPEVLDTLRPVLAENGLAVMQWPTTRGEFASVQTIVVHKSGLEMSFTLELPGGKTAQGIGSAITYARRYALISLFFIAGEDDDDDGNQATENAYDASRHPNAPPAAPTQAELDAEKREAKRRYFFACLTAAKKRAAERGETFLRVEREGEGFIGISLDSDTATTLSALLKADVEMDKLGWSDWSTAAQRIAELYKPTPEAK